MERFSKKPLQDVFSLCLSYFWGPFRAYENDYEDSQGVLKDSFWTIPERGSPSILVSHTALFPQQQFGERSTGVESLEFRF